MVVGITAALGGGLSLGLAYPTGLLFGQGYGLGVRQGYHSFKPSANPNTTAKHTSLNPLDGAFGAGQLSAEERTGGLPLGKMSDGSIVSKQKATLDSGMSNTHYIYNKAGTSRISKQQKDAMSLDEWRRWFYGSKQGFRRNK